MRRHNFVVFYTKQAFKKLSDRGKRGNIIVNSILRPSKLAMYSSSAIVVPPMDPKAMLSLAGMLTLEEGTAEIDDDGR
jgi:hypothetical protein